MRRVVFLPADYRRRGFLREVMAGRLVESARPPRERRVGPPPRPAREIALAMWKYAQEHA